MAFTGVKELATGKMDTEGDCCSVSILSKTIQLSPLDDNCGDKSFPLVFQCAKCAHILGDSTAWVCSNEDLRAVTLMRTKFPLFLSACF